LTGKSDCPANETGYAQAKHKRPLINQLANDAPKDSTDNP
jgi:hypothetical protein